MEADAELTPAEQAAQEMRRAIMAIERDTTLTAEQKAVRRQQLMNPRSAAQSAAAGPSSSPAPKAAAGVDDTRAVIDDALQCAICFNLCDRPVTVRRSAPSQRPPLTLRQVPCQHSFCLGCFTKWVQQSKTSCPKCRAAIPQGMRANPRINAALVSAIRMARAGLEQRPSPPLTLRLPTGQAG
jgi:E3 ubiquitin-protein ligase UHRF1